MKCRCGHSTGAGTSGFQLGRDAKQVTAAHEASAASKSTGSGLGAPRGHQEEAGRLREPWTHPCHPSRAPCLLRGHLPLAAAASPALPGPPAAGSALVPRPIPLCLPPSLQTPRRPPAAGSQQPPKSPRDFSTGTTHDDEPRSLPCTRRPAPGRPCHVSLPALTSTSALPVGAHHPLPGLH